MFVYFKYRELKGKYKERWKIYREIWKYDKYFGLGKE